MLSVDGEARASQNGHPQTLCGVCSGMRRLETAGAARGRGDRRRHEATTGWPGEGGQVSAQAGS